MFNKKRKSFNSSNKNNTRFKIIPGNIQHLGKRTEQEDSFGFSDIYNKELLHEIGALMVLADGMGGLSNGKLASNLVVNSMITIFTNKAINEPIPVALKRAVYVSNEKLMDKSQELGTIGDCGTTLVAANVYKDRLYWISVGDSGIYHHRRGVLKKLNTEHIYYQELLEDVKDGKITKEEAVNNPQKEFLTSFMGMEEIKYIDFNEQEIRLESNDLIILCSDGLFKTLRDNEILEVLDKDIDNPQEIVEELLKETLKKDMKYQDNITIIILKYLGL